MRGAGLLFLILLAGCQNGPPKVVQTPHQHVVKTGQLVVRSDFPIPEDHALIQDLTALGNDVRRLLELPRQREDVVVYLFASELEYKQFLDASYPNLPDRRAYFIGSSRELAVYTYWGDRTREDLRHEYTHGVLHACLRQVPLWLDEGLAEYFEVPGPTPGGVNAEYSHRLAAALQSGWTPQLERLEGLEEFSSMTYADYQEAWAWVHFLMHSTPDTQQILVEYLADLQHAGTPTPLSERLDRNYRGVESRLMDYLASMQTQRLLIMRRASPTETAPVQAPWGSLPKDSQPKADTVQISYQVELPDGLPESVSLTEESGQIRLMTGSEGYRLAHQTGWQEALDLYLDDSLDVFQEGAARRHGDQTRLFEDEFLHQARLSGLSDGQNQLRELVVKHGDARVKDTLIQQLLKLMPAEPADGTP